MLARGVFVADLSGSTGGLTAAHNRFGTYFRARVVPVNPNTSFQQTVRNIAGNLATAWVTTLTQLQRDAWDLYGANVAMTNKIGDTIFLTGLNHFLRSNTPRIQNGLARVDAAPTVFALTDVTLPVFTASEGGPTVDIAYDNTDAWAIIDDGFLSIGISRPANPSINYFRGPYRNTSVVLGNTATPPTSPDVSTPPFPIVQGQKLFAIVRGSTPDGRLSQPIRLATVVAA